MKRTKQVSRWTCVLAACALAAASATGRAAPLDDRVPADAIAYMGWAGADALKGSYGTSNLKGIIEASTIQDFVTKQLPGLIDQAGARDPNAAKTIEKLQAGLAIAWKHPAAFYFRSVDFSNPNMPVPRLGILCDAGPDAKALVDLLNEALAQDPAPPAMMLKVVQDGTLVSLSVGSADTPADLKKNGGLAGVAAYKAAMGNAKQANPAMAAYMDLKQTLAMANDAMAKIPDTPPEVKAKSALVIDALGIGSLTQAAMTAGFDGKGWSEQSFVGISGPKKGLMTLLDSTPLTESALAMVPKDAAAFSAWKMDLHKIYTEARSLVGKIDGPSQKAFDDGVAQAGAQVNLDLAKDVLAPLGDEWVLYRAPMPDAGGNSIVLVHKLRDGDTFAKTLATVEKIANAAMDKSPTKIEKVTTAKTEVSTIALLQYSIAWTVKNGTLYVSTLDGIGGAIKQVENKLPSVLESDAYKAARAALPVGAKPQTISYCDPSKLYPELRRAFLGVLPLARQAGVDVPNDLLPDTDDVRKFMTPGVTIMWQDIDGLHSAGKSAFPGAELLGGQQVGPGSVAVVAMGTAILLPSLGKAREMSNRTVDAANLRGIAQSCAVYAADNNDSLPDDLAKLVSEGMVAPKQMVNKQTGTEPLDLSPDEQKLAKDDFAKFAAQMADHTDYVYLGRGMKNQTDAAIVVAFDKPGPSTKDGINIAFQDAHVEFVRWPQMSATFKETNDYLKKNGKPPVDVAAMIKDAGVAVPANTRDVP